MGLSYICVGLIAGIEVVLALLVALHSIIADELLIKLQIKIIKG